MPKVVTMILAGGQGTRLYHFNLPFFHDLDPRTTRTPIRVHAIYRLENEQWVRLKRSELTQAIQ